MPSTRTSRELRSWAWLRPARSAGSTVPTALVLPGIALVLVFFVWPVGEIIRRSFISTDGGGLTAANYTDFLTTAAYVRVLGRTFTTAAVATVLCAVLAYPYAYLMTQVSARTQRLMLVVVLLPFWTSVLVRTYAWLIILQDKGVVNSALALVGVGPLNLAGSLTAVLIGMVQILIPFMVIPLFGTMSGIEPRLMHAARTLGARPVVAFVRVYLPLTYPGLLAGTLIVFIFSLGFYVTPAILGSPENTLLPQLIAIQASKLLDWGSAGAMAGLLLACVAVLFLLARRVAGPQMIEIAKSDDDD